MRNLLVTTCALCVVCLTSRPAAANELKSLQGTWDMKVTSDGKEYRIEKTVKDRQETVRTFEGETLVREHVVEFELKSDSDVSIFRWKNGKITAGPAQGQPLADGAFIYRLEEGKWTSVFGMLHSDTGPIHAEVWIRKPSE